MYLDAEVDAFHRDMVEAKWGTSLKDTLRDLEETYVQLMAYLASLPQAASFYPISCKISVTPLRINWTAIAARSKYATFEKACNPPSPKKRVMRWAWVKVIQATSIFSRKATMTSHTLNSPLSNMSREIVAGPTSSGVPTGTTAINSLGAGGVSPAVDASSSQRDTMRRMRPPAVRKSGAVIPSARKIALPSPKKSSPIANPGLRPKC